MAEIKPTGLSASVTWRGQTKFDRSKLWAENPVYEPLVRISFGQLWVNCFQAREYQTRKGGLQILHLRTVLVEHIANLTSDFGNNVPAIPAGIKRIFNKILWTIRLQRSRNRSLHSVTYL